MRHHAASPFCDSLRITVCRPDTEPNQMPFVSGIHQYARPARMTVDLHDLSLTSRQWAIYDPRCTVGVELYDAWHESGRGTA